MLFKRLNGECQFSILLDRCVVRSIYFLALLLLFTCTHSLVLAAMVPFVIPAPQDPNSLIALHSEPIGFDPLHDRIMVADDHFTRNNERINIWGVNLSFAGNLPTHLDAPIVADRLAAAGINSVRCHHLDTSNYPNGIWDPTDGRTIYPEALDRFDFLINELTDKGIYINLNLHVGRKHSQYIGLPDPTTKYDKIVAIFTPQLIQAQKDYARDLLDHVNPYRNKRLADDPAIAFVEITNENSLFRWGSTNEIRNLPAYYADLLRQQYNNWLAGEYGDTDSLRQVWNADAEPLGDNCLTSFEDHFNNPSVPPEDKWVVEQHNNCQANFELSQYDSTIAAKLTIIISDDTAWHLQIKQRNLDFSAGQYYTLSFDAVAEQPRTIWCNVQQDHDPWSNLGFSTAVELTTEWQAFTFGFYANADDTNGRVSFSFGGTNTATWYLTNVQLRTGGQIGLAEDEYIETGTVELFAENEVRQRTIDRMRFLTHTEKTYFDDMRSYIKNDLGCSALVTGTIVFGPLGLYAQSDMDFIDSHAYWQHPVYPGTPGDPADWYIQQKSMTDYIDEATLFSLAGCRLGPAPGYPGKPFTVSEYNHPAPLDSQAACVPMLVSFAAAQDWDGLWIYSYTHHSDAWDDNYFPKFFDILHNPAKWGFATVAAAIFRHRDLSPVGNTLSCYGLTDLADPLPTLVQLHLDHDLNMFAVLQQNSAISRQEMLNARVANTLFATGTLSLPNELNTTVLDWFVGTDGKGIYSAKGDLAHVYVGHHDKFTAATGNMIEVTEPNYLALTITPVFPDRLRKPLHTSQAALITACGRSENTNMVFSPDRTTVGTNWGQAPVRIEPVSAKIKFPFKGLICHALSPDGKIQYSVATYIDGDNTAVDLSPSYGTMWYLISASGDINGDGSVDIGDFTMLADYWLSEEDSADIAPLPFGDGLVNSIDLAVLLDKWNLE